MQTIMQPVDLGATKDPSAIHRQLTRLERVAAKFHELPTRMRSTLAMVIVPRTEPALPTSTPDVDSSELALLLDGLADKMESALNACTHVLNEVDL